MERKYSFVNTTPGSKIFDMTDEDIDSVIEKLTKESAKGKEKEEKEEE